MFRQFTTNDVRSYYVDWMNDPDIEQYLETRFYAQAMESCLRGTLHNSFFHVIEVAYYREIFSMKQAVLDLELGVKNTRKQMLLEQIQRSGCHHRQSGETQGGHAGPG